ncbi:TRAP transporter small permease subunit [Falsiroseomonas selenitidurans]|uniref:TRAP transporter small permease protein n=1 Tax=Falsiroseomonas selenitidurans TaxID=2716335 RepID=A0ABX1DY08_9PROT|nr:TRAP transporter small permease [Falsiroseomonas selenitidurans]NKC29250.1 TRAP transporter small permease [Falsiroseomonas selenitidurans]
MAELDSVSDAAQEAAARPPKDPFGLLLWLLNSAGTLMIAAMMVLIVTDVVGRSFFNAPLDGVAEIASKMIVAIVFLQLPAAIHAQRMTRADMFLNRLAARAPRTTQALEAAFAGIGVFVFWVIFDATLPQFLESWEQAEFFGVQGVWTLPTWPIRLAILIGCAGAGAASLVQVVRGLLRAGRPA